MKFKIKRDLLTQTLNKVNIVTSSKSLIPILNGFFVSVNEEGITIIGSDGDITIKSFIKTFEEDVIQIEDIIPGNIVIKAKLFRDIVKKLPGKTVTVEVDDEFHIIVKSGKSKFKLNGQDAKEYPRVPENKKEKNFSISSIDLCEAIKETVFATSDSETRPILTGVNFRLEANNLILTATNSHRLSMRSVEVNNFNQEVKQITIHKKTLQELNKILIDNNITVKVSIESNLVVFATDSFVMFSRLLEGQYPEVSRLIPTTSQTTIIATKKELLGTIERASLLATDNQSNIVKLTVDGGLMGKISSNSEIGNVSEEVILSNFEGEEITLSFSARYAIDGLKALPYEDIKLGFTGSMRPFIITPVENLNHIQLVLPVRTV